MCPLLLSKLICNSNIKPDDLKYLIELILINGMCYHCGSKCVYQIIIELEQALKPQTQEFLTVLDEQQQIFHGGDSNIVSNLMR